MRLAISLLQDNGTVIRTVTRDVPNGAVARMVAVLRDRFRQPEGGTSADLFETWANEVFASLREETRQFETREAGKGITPLF